MVQETSSRLLLTNILTALSSPPTGNFPSIENPLGSASNNHQHLMLALHVLFPNELLPALDLLDRHLLLRISTPDSTTDANRPERDIVARVPSTTYYVRSAQQKASSSRFHDPVSTNYEVRLAAWNCSCPAFAFSAFPSSLDDAEGGVDVGSGGSTDGDSFTAASAIAGTGCAADLGAEVDTWIFGGLARGDACPPICKHLLACVLVERCAMFSGFVEEKIMSMEEAAGWAAGWGG